MGSFSIFHWLVVLAVVMILFGAGRLPSVMGDLAKGIKAFRSGLKDDGDKAAETAPPAPVAAPTTQAMPITAPMPTQTAPAPATPAAGHPPTA